MMTMSIPVTFTLLAIALAMAPCKAQHALLEPAQISCNAAYSAPCARQNSRFLAMNVTNYALDPNIFFRINAGDLNMDTGFYPFVFDRTTKLCAAHGADQSLVGKDLQQIFSSNNLGYSDADALYARFEAAASAGGGWVQYLWSDGGSTNSKLAYVTSFNSTLLGNFMVGVGYEEAQLPPDLPCSDKFDSFCSTTNVRSLVGKAQFHLFEAAKSLENFESAVYDISFSDDFKIDGGFYAFMYNYDGRLKAHGVLRDSFGATLPEILEDKKVGTKEDGEVLHAAFVNAAEGSGWVQYDWRNSLNEPVYRKIALVVKVEFDNDDYYIGVGFNFEKESSSDGPLGEPCSDEFNLPCAFTTALQLSSHSRSHAISSDLPVEDIFSAISTSPDFRIDGFYLFFYEFGGNCVAHGLVPDFVGMTLSQIFVENNIFLDGDKLHNQFRDAATQGGGWVQYDWLIPGVVDSDFQKISYIFKVSLKGKDYYGGIGFNLERAPIQIDADFGQKKNGSPVACSSLYGMSCSEVNSRAILGEALAKLTLSSSDARVASQVLNPSTVEDILVSITSQSDAAFSVNDFFVMVFSAGKGECLLDDLSGCCVAHGGNVSMVHQTWEQILEADSITSIQGSQLHRQLLQRATSGGGWIEYPWSKATGRAQTKRWWTSRFRSDDQEYYVAVDYLKTEQPSTCDSCPDDQECTRNDQSYCEPKPEPPLTDNPVVLALIILFCAGTPLVGLFFWYQKRRTKLKSIQRLSEMKQKLQQMAEQLEKQMQGMVEVVANMPFSRQAAYSKQVGNVAGSSASTAVWYWEEDASYLESHKSSMVLSNSTFVGYHSDVSNQLETAYQLYIEGRGFQLFHLDLSTSLKGGKIHNADTGLQYEIDFDSFAQRNTKSNHVRSVKREEVKFQVDSTSDSQLPPLPDDIDFGEEGEDLLPTSKGQVIQVSKVHPDGLWLYGNVLYDPLIHDAQDQSKNQASALNDVLAHALHDRPTSGWFPKCVVQHADVNVMQKLLTTLGSGGLDTLSVPNTWECDSSGTGSFQDGKVEVPRGCREFQDVETYFMTALYAQADHVLVKKIERIQNLPLWQSYSVKKQTMLTRDTNNPAGRETNLDITDVERRWLFHGTRIDIVSKVERQGFNRAFAGRNAVAYGRGVYFARDASYSSHKKYSTPDERGIQRIFLCRVAVGDWCKGTNDQLTPDPKKSNNMDLFDTTVDNVANPSIFVVYHDAQAYPEYLVSFKSSSDISKC